MALLTLPDAKEFELAGLERADAVEYLKHVQDDLYGRWRDYLVKCSRLHHNHILEGAAGVGAQKGEVENSDKWGYNVRLYFAGEQIKHPERSTPNQKTVRTGAVAFMNNYGVLNRVSPRGKKYVLIQREKPKYLWEKESAKATDKMIDQELNKLFDKIF